ncbi:hypothetical protein L596_030062 [Steinernema carpocapsae]|uniref:VWFD domain-containing protein n=1 Tax=Steinernema carpocapsae TaxID=34508 RepID=A0A4U5LRN1_STECR|nr:hypothetical protein L596_030062 [Steinernema carpocapsae]
MRLVAAALLVVIGAVASAIQVDLLRNETGGFWQSHFYAPSPPDANNCCKANEEATCLDCATEKKKKCVPEANCLVIMKQIRCFCPFGTDGDGTKGCVPARRGAMGGDPHYTTFDGTNYDYHGTCPYVYSKPRYLPQDTPYYYEVKAKNAETPGNTATVESAEITMYGQKVFIDKDRKMFVNGERVYYPFYYPSIVQKWFTVENRQNTIFIRNRDFVEVQFKKTSLVVTLPDFPEYKGIHNVCGLNGNMNGLWQDDIISKDLLQYIYPSQTITPSRLTNIEVAKFLDTWITDDYPEESPDCSTGVQMAGKFSNSCDQKTSKLQCQPIKDAIQGFGPFANCKILGEKRLEDLYNGCAFDLCLNPASRCATFESFVATCQSVTSNIDVPFWRGQTNCNIDCTAISPFSSYSSCVQCQPTCDDPKQRSCSAQCYDGCQCDNGYLLDTSVNPPQCVVPEKCPCVDDDGQSHPDLTVWLNNGCTKSLACLDRKIMSLPKQCPENSTCGLEDGEKACVCKQGFAWNDARTACIVDVEV